MLQNPISGFPDGPPSGETLPARRRKLVSPVRCPFRFFVLLMLPRRILDIRVALGDRGGSARRSWLTEETVKRFGTKFCLATREVHQADYGAELDREEDFYTALDSVVVAIYFCVWTIRWWPVVGGTSRHSCSKDRSVYSSKGVESRGVQQDVWKWRIEDLGANIGYVYEML
ncbi:hypothetical protein DEO72_LG8g1603 [Vigna unguiculata]|uniref:Uncharacterized protein n=1 Tax=Vigna unguiculata TaxID=3917 RepID=A0A4D6MR97_VIGUN|nr:hypothetical protein DEO72_LG8g1603 [Vigna unguiculata]